MMTRFPRPFAVALLVLFFVLGEVHGAIVAPRRHVSSAANDAFAGLLNRTFGGNPLILAKFDYSIANVSSISAGTSNDTFSVTCSGEVPNDVGCTTIHIEASSVPAAGVALHQYMKHSLNSSVTWGQNRSGYHVPIPSIVQWMQDAAMHTPGGVTVLPKPTTTAASSQGALGQFRYALNVCTYGYSTVFWGQEEWAQLLDWMALHGINLPLASEGVEYVWYRTYTEAFGLASADVLEYFTGVAFLPWNRMGNIHTWGGPMTEKFLAARADLQRFILGRMRELGISPVLPAFAGHVPMALAAKYPSANITRSSDWLGSGKKYSENGLLLPRDPLFGQISAAFLSRLGEEFGEADFYSGDTYNEMVPSSTDHAFLAQSSQAVYDGIKASRPGATWLMQGWLFHENSTYWTTPRVQAYLSGVPVGGLLVLDLFSDVFPQYERTHGYFGHKFIWCMLHNFGGKRGIYGNMSNIAITPRSVYASGAYPSLAGFGITMEAIGQMDVIYELMMDTPWVAQSSLQSPLAIDLKSWLATYGTARYGGSEAAAVRGVWYPMTQNDGPLTRGIACCDFFSSVLTRPWLQPATAHGFAVWTDYDPDTLLHATRDAVKTLDPNNIALTSTVRYDLVDLTRQVIENVFTEFNLGLWAVLNRTDVTVEHVLGYAGAMQMMIAQLDSLVNVDENFLLQKWIDGATYWADTADPTLLNELRTNALLQVTLWGPSGERFDIDDYAVKPWNGLFLHYAMRRWDVFWTIVQTELATPHRNASAGFTLNRTAVNDIIKAEVEVVFVDTMTNYTFDDTPEPRLAATKTREALSYWASSLKPGTNAVLHRGVTVGDAKQLLFRTWTRDAQLMYAICRGATVCAAFSPHDGCLWRAATPLVPSANTSQALYVLVDETA